MKRIILGLLTIVSLCFSDTKNIIFDDVDWIYNRGTKECLDVKQSGYGVAVINMVNGKGYAVNAYFKDIKMTEFTDGKLTFWTFPDKSSCEQFKKNL